MRGAVGITGTWLGAAVTWFRLDEVVWFKGFLAFFFFLFLPAPTCVGRMHRRQGKTGKMCWGGWGGQGVVKASTWG